VRLSIELEPESGILTLPIHYNHLVQGMIYRSLDEALAEWIHNTGYAYGKRRFKLFTFSRLLSRNRRYNRDKRTITFTGPVRLKIASVEVEILESLAVHLVRQREVKLNESSCHFTAVRVEMPVQASEPVMVRTLSPIVVYRTLRDLEGRKKTYYFTPWEREFQSLILDNLRRKWAALHGGGDPPPMRGAYVRPVKVSKRNEVITTFKGTVIKGWTGIYEICLPEPYFTLAYDAGLGSKNSQGFGMVEILKDRLQSDDGARV